MASAHPHGLKLLDSLQVGRRARQFARARLQLRAQLRVQRFLHNRRQRFTG